MINFRNIFNPSYNYIGIVIIFIITTIIVIIQKETLTSIYQISKTSLIAGIITLVIALTLDFIMNFLIISSFKVFIEVISKNVINNMYFYSIIITIISGLIHLITRIIISSKQIPN